MSITLIDSDADEHRYPRTVLNALPKKFVMRIALLLPSEMFNNTPQSRGRVENPLVPILFVHNDRE